MSIKTTLGNGVVAIGGYFGAKTAVLASAAPKADVAMSYAAQFNDPYSIVGFVVPNWLGVALYVIFWLAGAVFGGNQKTPVDGKFKRPWLKPIYSMIFGVAMTLFVMPLIYPNITIWGLILPVLFFTSIGAVAIYMVIAFFTSEKLWSLITLWAHGGAGEVLAEITRRGKNALKAIFGGGQ